MSFYQSFTETLIHSTWQSALLVLLYAAVNFISADQHPLKKRNFLFSLLATQLIISVWTFFYLSAETVTGHSLITTVTTDNSFFNLLNDYSNQIFFVYAAVVFTKAFSVVFNRQAFQRQYTKQLIKPSPDLKIFTQIKAYHLGIKRKVQIWYSNHITAPITFGFLKPVILLPVSLVNRISTEQAEAIIIHELSHIKSRDYLLNWFLISMQIIYFFNPFISILAKRIRLEREKSCDLQVINFDYNDIVYAEALLQTAKLGYSFRPFQLSAAASQLLKRISFFSESDNIIAANSAGRRFSFAFIPAASLLLIFATGIFRHYDRKIGAFTANTTNIYTEPVAYSESRSFTTSSPALITDKAVVITDSSLPDEEAQPDAASEDPAVLHSYADADANNLINIIPVAMKNLPDSIQNFTYEIETQAGKVTQAFKLIKTNGRLIVQPQWMMLQTKADSLRMSVADSLRYFREIMPQ